jgi:hypothetical protein
LFSTNAATVTIKPNSRLKFDVNSM